MIVRARVRLVRPAFYMTLPVNLGDAPRKTGPSNAEIIDVNRGFLADVAAEQLRAQGIDLTGVAVEVVEAHYEGDPDAPGNAGQAVGDDVHG